MIKNGLIESRREGKTSYYHFSSKGARIISNVALNFKSLDWSNWDDKWWGIIFSVPEENSIERYKIRKKLSVYRFASAYPGFWIRPVNEIEKIEIRLSNIFTNKHCHVIQFKNYHKISKEKISHIWELDNINSGFMDGLTLIKGKKDKIEHFNSKEALVEKMSVGDIIVNLLFKDPLLPSVFLPESWKAGELRREFFNWDKQVTEIAKPYWEKIFY
jgi:DNA-binding transcriptional regulator PaaX